ncbi:hypothetical protein OG724_27825 [[Kitasatospora] papulosa]|uniref:hypothetical protein n=1 Tax=[Kitasatospora] papulosa TaxID=1464011 RepID=UPI002E369135|nr:hypothetical protein [[Kitasatospora] papulosa]
MREYVTITKDPRTDLILAIGGTDEAADILQRTDGFLSAAARAYDGLPIEQQQLRATTASHSLRAAGHSVHLDPALNTLSTPNGERDAALRYLSQLGERVAAAESGSEVAGVLTRSPRRSPGCCPSPGKSSSMHVILHAHNHAASTAQTAASTPPSPTRPPAAAEPGASSLSRRPAAKPVNPAGPGTRRGHPAPLDSRRNP